MEEKAYLFDLTIQPRSIIKVVGVGGGGSNAVNFMFNQGFRDVEFVVCNTDAQALYSSHVPSKIQLGTSLLGGLGAGSIPENGREAAIQSEESIREMLGDGTKMVFITAGMGGGTGTGAAPVIARVAKELGILAIGIVTKPFRFEGPTKNRAAEKGIAEMRQYCDTVIEILNDKIRDHFGNMAMNQAFAQADIVLSTSAKSISEIITVPGIINVDFKDIETTMKDSGTAVMGSASAKGEGRALNAVHGAISSPLLNNNEIEGATKILLAITYGASPELTMDEFYEITDFIQQRAGDQADVIFGTTMDPDLGDTIQVTIVATGFVKDAAGKALAGHKVTILEQPVGLDNTHFGHQAQPEAIPPGFGVHPTSPSYNPAPQPPAYVPPAPPQPAYAPQPPTHNPYEIAAQNGQNPGYTYQTNPAPQPRTEETRQPEPPAQEQKLYLDINGNYQAIYAPPDNVERPIQHLDEYVPSQRADFGKPTRAEILKQLSSQAQPKPNYDDPDFLRQNETPAYQRKNTALEGVGVVPQPQAPSSEAMSRYTLNENGEILGNNRFLHDNPD